MNGKINIYLRNWDSSWKWNVMMSLNCWITKKPHSDLCRYIKFHKPMKMAFSLPPSLCLWDSERPSLEELFIHAPGISVDLHFVWKKNKLRKSWSFCHFPKCCMFVQKGLDFGFLFSFSVSFLSASFLLQKSYPCTPVAVLSTSWQTHYQIWRHKN